MGRAVLIASGNLESTKELNRYALGLTGKKHPNVLFIGTASMDDPGYQERIKDIYAGWGCKVLSLCIAQKDCTQKEMEDALAFADLIYIGGGDTVFMMERFRKTGLDRMLVRIYEEDLAVLSGISAGAICFFECGFSDSIPDGKGGYQYGMTGKMMSVFPYVFCPHYEDPERLVFDEAMRKTELSGYALFSDTAFVSVDGKTFITGCSDLSGGFFFSHEDGRVRKEALIPVPVRTLQV